ncbi:hypothetical protein Vadar_007545 [Vaccinium darrowii]|uniref:Uncharacterized protein n=1 Tax=Vaccinium darrowii TaxID=229202 RepID=A0ACB7XYR1_9ERIC|nr:hypothetical protein Vadar_007545 [Vaccinium darrowii]
MGRNKKKPNPPPPPPTTATGAPPPPPPPTNNPNQEQTDIDQELSLIESECQAAIAAYTAGNPGEAFTLIEETRHRYENCGIVYAAQYELHALEASRVETSDAVLFQKHVRSGVESARLALSLLPYSTELRTSYAQALYKLSGCVVDGFDEVLRECERVSSVENPLHHCRDASLSLMARDSEETSESESFRMSERKKKAVLKEVVSATVKMGKSRTYWNAMSDEGKIGLIGPRIGDLRQYYSSLFKDGSAIRVFSEGIDYAEKNKNWKFWLCYYCDEKFEDFELRTKHIEQMHEGVIGQNSQMKPFLFQEIDAVSGGSEAYDNFLIDGNVYIINERIVLAGDSSRPLDDRLLRVEVIPHRHHDGVEDDEDSSALTCSICDAEVAVPPDLDAFGQWLFDGPPTSTTEELSAWKRLQDQMKQEGMEVPKLFEEEFILFQSLRGKQSELMVQCRSLRGIVIICAQELHNREQGGEHVAKSYKSLLGEKLWLSEDDSMSPAQRSELSAIVGVLTEAQNIRHARDQAALVEDEEDASIRMAIQKKMDLSLSELCTNEAQITRNSVVMLRLWAIYNQTGLDYRSIMLPLVRNFIHAKLEALVYEDEKQKSDAATEALLAELALDTKKSTSKGNSHPKLSKKTSKAKKKIKDHREVKDPKATKEAEPIKATSSDKVPVAQEEKTEQENLHAASLKLEEMLDLQRKFEEEAKQKALAKETTNEAEPPKATPVGQEEKAEQASEWEEDFFCKFLLLDCIFSMDSVYKEMGCVGLTTAVNSLLVVCDDAMM